MGLGTAKNYASDQKPYMGDQREKQQRPLYFSPLALLYLPASMGLSLALIPNSMHPLLHINNP